MDLEEIFRKAEEEYNKPPALIGGAIQLSETKGHRFGRVFKSLDAYLGHIYRLSPDLYALLESITGRPSVVDYILQSIEHGIPGDRVLHLDFSLKQKTYAQIVGSVTENVAPLTERERILNEFRQVATRLNAKPKPEIVYVPMTRHEVEFLSKNKVAQKRILGNTSPITYNPEAHIIAAVMCGDNWRPLVNYVVDNDKYPEQVFSGEFEKWIYQMDALYVTDELRLGQVLYFIDSLTENFYFDSFMTHWHSNYGASFAGVLPIKGQLITCPPPTEQDEFFCGNSYRLNPGDYDSVILDPLIGNYTASGPNNLLIQHDYNNTGYLAYNQAGSGPQTFYRVFRSTPNRPKSNAYIFLSGYGEEITIDDITITNVEQDVTRDNVVAGRPMIDLKLPGLTGWLSCNKFFARRTFTGKDGDGILLSFERFGPGILEVTFEKFNTGHCGREAIMRITYPDKHVTQLQRVSFLNWRDLYSPYTPYKKL